MSFLKDIVKELDNEFAGIADDEELDTSTPFINTGSYSLNALLSGSIFGGLPGNRITGLAGENQTGKTYYMLAIVKHFLMSDPKAEAALFDSEKALTKEMLVERGVDTSRVAIIPVDTVEEFRTQALTVVEGYEKLSVSERPPFLMALDSLGNLSTNKELRDIADGTDKRDMTRAPLIKGAFRALTNKLGKMNIPMIVTNHTYDVIGAYMPTKEMGGGSGLKYAASTIVFLSASKDRDNEKDVIGSIIRCHVTKSRFTRPYKRVETLLNYDTGLSKYHGLIELAIEAGVWTEGKAKEDDGKKKKKEVKPAEEENKKKSSIVNTGNGVTAKKSRIMETPETFFTQEVLEKIDAFTKSKYRYGSANDSTNQPIPDLGAWPTDGSVAEPIEKLAKTAEKELLKIQKAATEKPKRGRPKKKK